MPIKTSNDEPRPANAPQPKGVHRSPQKEKEHKRNPDSYNAFPGADTPGPNKGTTPSGKARGPATFVRGLSEAGFRIQSGVVMADDIRVTYAPITHNMWVATLQQNPTSPSVTLADFHKRVKQAVTTAGLEQIRMRVYKPCDAVHPPARLKAHLKKLGVQTLDITVR